MPKITTCGGLRRATEFSYDSTADTGFVITFEHGLVSQTPQFIDAIIAEFRGRSVRGGFKMDGPPPGGFGKWIQDNSARPNSQSLTARHASFIAAILRDKKYLNCRNGRQCRNFGF